MCEELLSFIPEDISCENYDAVIIDEAQDLPSSFFRLLFKSVKQPKRIIWAYDEPQRDIILPICYRNPPWTLAMAHALGFGIYNSSNIDQLISMLEQGGIDKDMVPELDILINVLNKKKLGNE